MSEHPGVRSYFSLPFDETKPAIGMNFSRTQATELDQPANSSEVDQQSVGSTVVKVISQSNVTVVGHQNGKNLSKRQRKKYRRKWFDDNNARAQPCKRAISPCEQLTAIKKCTLNETVSAKILVTLAQVDQHGLNDTQASTLTNAIINATYNRNVTFKPRIYSAGYNYGRYELFGADFETLNWATSIIPTLKDLWEGANIHITYAGPIPKLTKATINIPGNPIAPETFFAQINWLNEDVNTSMWRIFSHDTKSGKNVQNIHFGIDQYSLSVLAKKNFKLFFGIGHLSIRLCKNQ